MSGAPRVTAIVVSFESARTIAPCLRSLAEEARRVPLEIVVADNASRDASVARIREAAPAARLLRLEANLGFSSAVNRAARGARGDYLLLLNPDAELVPGALLELVATLDADRGAAIAGPRIVDGQGRLELSEGPMTGFLGEAWQKLRARLPRREGGRSARRPVDWVSGACLLVRRESFERVGGMDEGFFLYFEDVDLCARLRALGQDVLYCPRALVRHARGESARALPERVRAEYRNSQIHFYRKHHGAEAAALLEIWLRVTGKLSG